MKDVIIDSGQNTPPAKVIEVAAVGEEQKLLTGDVHLLTIIQDLPEAP